MVTERVRKRVNRERERAWQQVQKLWGDFCGGVDEALAKQAEELGGSVERWDEDTPSRALLWQEGGIQYSISMLLEGAESPLLKIWATAWRDNERERIRRWLKPHTLELPTPINREEYPAILKRLVERLNSKSWVFSTPNYAYGMEADEVPLK